MTDRTTDNFADRLLRSSRTFFGRWQGVNGEMRELTVSIKHLKLVLSEPGREGNLVVSCLDPAHICGPVRWRDCRLELRERPTAPGDDHPFALVDEAAGLEIVCGAVQISENVKLR